MKKLKEEYQPGGSKRHEILEKLSYILDPKFGTQNMKHAFLLEQVGLTESEYLTCLNKLTLDENWLSRRPGAPMARVYLGHWRWLQATRTKLQAPSRKLQAPSRKLDKGPVLCYRIFKEKESMKVNEALKITDSFTRTSKMPGLSYSLPAWECKTGWKLSQVEGTPCFFCYAKKGNYTRYPAIKAAQYRRLEAIKNPLTGSCHGCSDQAPEVVQVA